MLQQEQEQAQPSESSQPRRRPYTKHGLTRLKTAVRVLGGRVLDRRTTIAKALDSWRADLVADLGGRGAISTQQDALVNLAVKTKLMLDSIDNWLLSQPTLVNARKRTLIPVVKERLALSGHLVQILKDLGLERRARNVPSLEAYLRQRATSPQEAAEAQTDAARPLENVDDAASPGDAPLPSQLRT